jgi:hypothetical protein
MDLLPNVLQFVDCRQSLSSCARVAHSWLAAATAATADISITISRQRDPTASLCQWLTKHGGRQVQSINISRTHDYSSISDYYPGQPVITMKLPFQHLQQLRSLSLSAVSQGSEIELQCWPAQQ